MNKLMFAPFGAVRYMEAAGDGGGGGGGDPKDPPADPKDPPKDPPADPKDPPADPKDPPKDPPADPKDPPKDPDDPVSALAQKVKDPPADPKDPPADPKDPPKEVKDEDYLKAMVADEATKKAAGDDKMEISQELAKRMLPALREAGLNPEQSAKLANVFAREQIAAAVKHREEVAATMKEMNDAAFKQYPEQRDWDLIGAARDHFFKQGGTMSYTIAKSFLGADKEFLALLHFAGEKLAADDTPTGGAAGAGKKPVNYAKALGIE